MYKGLALESTPRVGHTGTWLRVVAGAGLALVSVGLLVLALPPFGAWPLIFVAFVPMALAWFRVLPAALSSLAPGITFSGYAYLFVGRVLDNAPGLPAAVRLLPLLGGALLIMLLTRSVLAYHTATGFRWQPLQSTVGWIGLELIFSFIPYIATWPFVGYALYSQAWLIQPVSVLGMYALDALIMLCNYSLGLAAVWAWDLRRDPHDGRPRVAWRVARTWLLITAVLLATWVAASLLLDRSPSPRMLRVAGIQPNQEAFFAPGWRAAPPSGWQATTEQRAWPLLLEQTRDAARQGAQLIVWPEGALRADPASTHGEALSALARETQAYLVVPYVVETPAGLRNEAIMLDPAGTTLGVYHKSHPVPGELAPAKRAYPVFDTPAGRLAMMICYDADFLDTTRKLAAAGAQVIAVPSADWPAIGDLHYTHLVFRSVENRVATVKADWSFDSAAIDPSGRIVQRVVNSGGERATLLADVALGNGPTLASRFGDLPGWFGLAGMIGFAVAGALRGRRTGSRAGASNTV